MKKSTWLGAVCCLAALDAHAQSSVTLYGIVDAGLTYVNHAATPSGATSSALRFGNGVAQASRWGIKGIEDLGGGTKAVFVLENGFSIADGTLAQGGAMFGRQAYVGISKNDIGTLTLGRQYSFSTEFIGNNYSIGVLTAVGNFGFHINAIDQETASQLNNTIKFDSANFHGLTFGALYGFSTQAGAFGGAAATTAPANAGSSRSYSFGVNYDNGQFGVGAAYTTIDFPAAAVPALTLSIANVATNGMRALSTYAVGARYIGGPATVFGNWSDTHFTPLTSASSVFQNYEIGVSYALTGALSLALGYTYSDLSGGVHGRWHQVNSGVDYALSKRTDVYVLASYQKASGSNTVGGATIPVQAEIGAASSFVGNSGSGAASQLAARVGIRHKF